MKLPTKVTILGERYQIKQYRLSRCIGQCRYEDRTIVVAPNQSIDAARDTLLHEIIHAIDHVDALHMTEEQVRRVATGLRSVFASNPRIAKFIAD